MPKPPTRPDLKSLKLGPLGDFPEDQLTAEDSGALRLAITTYQGRVIIDFGEDPVAWIGMPPDVAEELAASLIEYARQCKA
jgi:hypothetical protein